MRLIDADAYRAEMKKRQDACAEWRDESKSDGAEELYARAEQALATFIEAKLTLDKMPTIDAVPVVRCAECRWWDEIEGSPIGYCHACKHGHYSNNWEISIYRTYKGDFFCADGERKDGGADA